MGARHKLPLVLWDLVRVMHRLSGSHAAIDFIMALKTACSVQLLSYQLRAASCTYTPYIAMSSENSCLQRQVTKGSK